MFSKPSAGWSTIEIEGFRGYASYIQPFVCATLSAITQHLVNGSSQCVNYDEEGSDFTIVFTRPAKCAENPMESRGNACLHFY